MAIVVCIAVVALIGFIYFVAKYKLSGLFGYISFIGFTAILWLALKGIGITISIEGIVAIVVMLIANYMWINYILKRISKDENVKQVIKESYIHYTYILIPLAIIAVVFTFTRWTVISSIGMVMVWALMIMFIYQYAITKVLLDK